MDKIRQDRDKKWWTHGVSLHSFVTSAVDGEWSTPRPGRFLPPSTHPGKDPRIR